MTGRLAFAASGGAGSAPTPPETPDMRRPPAGTAIPIEGLTNEEDETFPMAEQQLSAPSYARYVVRRSLAGVRKVTEFQHPGFTIIGDHLAQHRELSLTAIGLATYIQSLPEGAPVDIRTLAEKFPEGRERVATALRALEAYGYIERVRERTDNGKLVTVTYSYNNPEATRARRAREAAARSPRRTTGAPTPEEPAPARPTTAEATPDAMIEAATDAMVEATPEPAPGPAPEPAPEPVPAYEPTPGPVPRPAPGPAPQPAPGPVPEPALGPEPASEPVPEPAPEPVPGPVPAYEPTPGPAPQPAPGPAPESVPEPATEPGPVPQPARGPAPVRRAHGDPVRTTNLDTAPAPELAPAYEPAPEPEPVPAYEPTPGPVPEPVPEPVPAHEPAPVRRAEPAPVRTADLDTDPAPVRTAHAAPAPRRVPSRPRLPLPRPRTSEHRQAAAALLAELRRADPRLLLSVRDVHRLAPAVAAWLERGADPDAVRHTLTTGLPAPLRHPAALLAHRLTALLPPRLPNAPAAPTTGRPHPFQTCDTCDRAFRAPAPGHCRDCREAAGRAVPQPLAA